jgi:aryl-alcohol dehydrogenase-like predicted oxidoreductase
MDVRTNTSRRTLGSSGLTVSVPALGGNVFGPPRLDQRQTVEVISAALDLGVDFVDVADVYGQGEAEQLLGVALRGRRDRMTIATKFNLRSLGDEPVQDYVRAQAEQSLRRLGTEHIDLYQLHLPRDDVAMAEVLSALDTLITQGKVRAIGACNFSAWRLAESAAIARELGVQGFSTVQNYYHVMSRQLEIEVVPYAQRTGLGVLPYHPLAGGFLTGKYREGALPPPGSRGASGSRMIDSMLTQENFRTLAQLVELASSVGRDVGQLALAWLAAQPAVSAVIAGASDVEQLRSNVEACTWVLGPDLAAAIDDVVTPGRSKSPECPPYGVNQPPRSPRTSPAKKPT